MVPSRALVSAAPLLDVAYDPWPTALGAAWIEGGGRVVHGLEHAAAPGAAAGAHLRERRPERRRSTTTTAVLAVMRDALRRPCGRIGACSVGSPPESRTGLSSSRSSRVFPPVSPSRSTPIRADLARRKLGYGRGARMKFEQDELAISGGVRHGVSLGSPIALRIGNTEWPRWSRGHEPRAGRPRRRSAAVAARRSPGPAPATPTSSACRSTTSTRPAPCSSARAPARRPPASRSAPSPASFLAELGIRLVAHTLSIGPVRVPEGRPLPMPDDVDRARRRPAALLRPRDIRRHGRRGRPAHEDGDTLGGVVEVLAYGVPPGLGSYVHWDRRLDSQLAAALMGIQAIKGVEVGDGFLTTTRRGSEAHDELAPGRRPHRAARATGPAAPRAACPRAPCCACAPA